MKKINIFIILLLISILCTVNLHAQFIEYNHPELNWYTIDTKHFQVHYHDGTERTARLTTKILEEIYEPLKGEAADKLTLTMHVSFLILYAKEVDLVELAQSALFASLPPEFTAVPNSLELFPISEFETNQPGIRSWKMRVEEKIIPYISSAEVAALTQGRSVEKASQNLQENLNLAAEPKITISPSWWKWLPIAPFRINLIVR